MKTINYAGHECCILENGTIRLLVTQSVGPRILSFGYKDGDNLFAELPNFVTELPDGKVFHFYGGHRLWIAPEDLGTTYIPDDDPVEIAAWKGGLTAKQKLQSTTSLQKTIEIQLAGESRVVITHKLTNYGSQPIACAPWAITQFKPGGVAVLPQAIEDTGVLPNRSLALWRYTDIANPNVIWGNEYIVVAAKMKSPFKVGFPNPRGWLAYWLNGTLFVKHVEYNVEAKYYDYASSSECYCNDQFLELETLAPATTIQPNGTTLHIETWELYKNIDRPQNENEAQALANALNLE